MTTKQTNIRRKNVNEEITDRILNMLRAGDIPWRKPWVGGSANRPRNLRSGKTYRGINVWILSFEQAEKDYTHPLWLTFKQAKDFGGSVRKGEKGTRIVFWKPTKYEAKNEAGDTEQRKGLLARMYTVFNIGQCDGLERLIPAPRFFVNKVEPQEAAQAIVDEYFGQPDAPKLNVHGTRACYMPALDAVRMPSRQLFQGDNASAEYYSTFFHEMVHSTGHKSRLDRFAGMKFEDHRYSREELVAEFGSAFLCGEAGISAPVIENQAAYIQNWMSALRDDDRAITVAAGRAQKACDAILGVDSAEGADNGEATAEKASAA